MNIPILFEDDVLLVINKPPGVVVNRAESVKGETVQEWALLRQGFGGQAEQSVENKDFFDRAGIVHRIDKETSGCLIIAKTPDVFIELQRQFKERMIKKTYLAITHGILVPKEGEIRAPVGRLPWNRERFGIVPGGKEAVTKYRVLHVIPAPEPGSSGKKGLIPGHTFDRLSASARNDMMTVVELYPETGRTHQIRVHLKYINHPIIGDWQYAGRKTARRDRMWAPRVMLHAWKIIFDHPTRHEPVAITAPVPDDMNGIINTQS